MIRSLLVPGDRVNVELEKLLHAVEAQVQAAGLPPQPVRQLRQALADYHHTEEQGHHREQTFETLLENAPDIIGRFDRELRYLYVNPAITPSTGLRPEQFLGKTHRELGFPDAFCTQFEAKLRQAFSTRQKVTFEFPFPTPSGQEHWHHEQLVPELDPATGQVTSVMCVGRDITEAKHLERVLREGQEHFRSLLEAAPDATVIVDQAGRITLVNQQTEKLFGYTRAELLGQPVEMLLPPPFRSLHVKHREAYFVHPTVRTMSERPELFGRRKDGREFPVEISLSPIQTPQGLLVSSAIRDVTERKEAERALRESRDRLALALEAGQAGLTQWDIRTHTLLWNPRHYEIFGYPPDSFTPTYEFWRSRVHPEDLPRLETEIRRSTKERQRDIAAEYRILRPDGEVRWVRGVARFHYNPAGEAESLIGIVLDITDSKRVEDALRTSEERFRLLVEGIKDYALFLLDPQGCIIGWNSGAERIKGYKAEEILGRHVALCYEPADIQQGKPQANLDLAAQQGHCEWEGWVVRKDGSRFWAEVLLTALRNPDGSLQGFAEIARDITQRQETAHALRESEEWLRLAVDATDLGTWNYYPPTGKLLWSDRCKAMFGLPPDTPMTYERFLTFVHPEDRAFVHHAIQQSCDTAGTGRQNMEYRVCWPDGTTRWIKAQGKTFFAGEGSARYAARIVGTAHDITERRAIEGQLHAAREAAETANRAKDHFIAMLSHELRTPLTPVLTAVQMMERDPTLSSEQRESAHLVQRNVALETRLIDDLLDLTRITRGKLELHLGPVDLHSLLGHVLTICDSDLRGKQLALAVELQAPHHHVQGDAARLQQVFWNLLKNAIKFTPRGGRITVRTEPSGDEWITVTLRDTGVGITPELLPTIFNAFEQGNQGVTRLFGGLGLGLAISKGLVELHGGTLTATSPGQGQRATFTTTLPVTRAVETTRPSGGAWTEAPPHLKGGRILLVEDNVDTVTVMTKLLKGYGYEVRLADSVAAAQRAVAAEPFDLLLCDIGLPDGSGLDLMRQLTRERPLKGIALSGYGMEEDLRKSQDAGFLAHLTKPVDLDVLEHTLDQLLKDPPP